MPDTLEVQKSEAENHEANAVSFFSGSPFDALGSVY